MAEKESSCGSIISNSSGRCSSRSGCYLDRSCYEDRDDRGWSSLHIAARKGNLKKVKKLLNQGADVNVAAWGNKYQGVTPLHLAAEGGHVDVMDELLEWGANIDARTRGIGGCSGWTPLHNAAKERKRDAVKLLVENGAFLPDDMEDCRFNPPLYYCDGLEWAYEEMKRLQLQQDNSNSEEEESDGGAEA